MSVLDGNFTELSRSELESTEGGVVGLVTLGVAAFTVGYMIGKDLATKNK